MRLAVLVCLSAALAFAQQQAASNLLQVKRIYVEPMAGGAAAVGLRDQLISGIDSTKLFVLTDNPDRADAILKGAAEDHAYEQSLDTSDGVSTHEGGGRSSASKSAFTIGSGLSAATGAQGNESHHLRDRKHEAFASIRLCNRDGDVIWSTTQESNGAKFRSASSDVAEKVARQLELDVAREQAAQAKPSSK